ncbi:hypothetical protein [Enterococcus bulliens]
MLSKYKFTPYLILLGCAVLLSLPQLLSHNVMLGADYIFHYNRFYETAMQLKTGNFNYFLSIFSFQTTARMINALYGPVMAYLQGLLLLIAGTWFRYQLLTNFLLFFLSGSSMFYLLKKSHRSTGTSLFFAISYMTSYAILYGVYRQSFTSWGAVVFPFALVPLIKMIEEKKIEPLRLAIAIAVVAQVHFFTSLLVVLIYFLAFCYVLTQKIDWFFIRQLALSILIFLCLTANIWVVFLSVYPHDAIQAPFVNADMSSYTIDQSSHIWLDYPMFFLAFIVLQWLLYLRQIKSLPKITHVLVWMSAFFLFLSTSILPWSYFVEQKIPFVTLIQFPFRFFVPFIVLLFLSLAYLLDRTKIHTLWSWKILGVLLCLISLTNAIQGTMKQLDKWDQLTTKDILSKHTFVTTQDINEIKESFYTRDLNQMLGFIIKSTPDYLPTEKENIGNRYNEYEKHILFNPFTFSSVAQKNGELIVTWQAKQEALVTLPLINYAHTTLQLNGHTVESDIDHEAILHLVTVTQQTGTNTLIVGYHYALYVLVGLWLTFFSWLALLVLGIGKLKKRI